MKIPRKKFKSLIHYLEFKKYGSSDVLAHLDKIIRASYFICDKPQV